MWSPSPKVEVITNIQMQTVGKAGMVSQCVVE